MIRVPEVVHTPWLRTLPDGTIKQGNPFTGDQVWTIPGRAHRPMAIAPAQVRPLEPGQADRACAFCSDRLVETPPEKVRSVWRGTAYERLRHVLPGQGSDAPADFRRTANLFEIVSADYWRVNHGRTLPPQARAWWEAYAAAPGGRGQLVTLIRQRLGAASDGHSEQALIERAQDFFVSTHDLVMGRRHYVDGALTDDQLASSGSLTPTEHREFIALTAEAVSDIYRANPAVRYVSTFQNWLRPAGASFDHLHKQVVGIDEHGGRIDQAMAQARQDPSMWNVRVLDPAVRLGLVIAENVGAVAIAGVGHRFPSVEVWSLAATGVPGAAREEEQHAVADLLHALHAATGARVPSNEEWHHAPPDVDVRMPWHVVLKWRISTPAGFEGDTKIYTNTIGPWDVRERMVTALGPLRADGYLAPEIRIGDECRISEGALPRAL